MKKFSRNFIIRSEILYERISQISYILDDYLYEPEDKLIRDKLNKFKSEFFTAVNLLVDEEQSEKCFISRALINYLNSLSLLNEDATINNLIDEFASANCKDFD